MYLWSDFVQLVMRPITALARIRDHRQLHGGLLAFGISLVASTLVSELAAIRPYPAGTLVGLPPDLAALILDSLNAHRFALPVYSSAAAIPLWILALAFIHFLARRLGGRGTFYGYMKVTGYIALMGLIALPLSLLQVLSRAAGLESASSGIGLLLPILQVGLFVWQNVLYVFAAQVNYSIPVQRAMTAVVGPIGCVFGLLVGLLILAIIATALVLGSVQ